MPYDGSIDWARALLAFQKVGYTGPWTFELAPGVHRRPRWPAPRTRGSASSSVSGINDELMSQ